ncbi:hypothetical protein COX69_01345 [Candidatus Falkowbacteria bacterium CG_4_10_14_0_2_um_filter_48_10]|uniref:Uncharacterized protein n=1 Tax=Candidatus Falkowbacteria bacterium CG23_combo_of_CG06-09_8_20_14_all_49_15 TaxID=1974572 RepID=A0A2G9ZLF0_9BACT|nr:MAG: hypothetical protein COX22_01320 [Candidatus Falkowbacteria bacterium CG23_combo_of_CG06-09_8_20_14_all_49_15]PJA08757.1 MAG: hypothetical protein COX69_01345 [Candidatus Falkowbacteria bacterium CG_4_10_14_0_2_um_filter_48_10]
MDIEIKPGRGNAETAGVDQQGFSELPGIKIPGRTQKNKNRKYQEKNVFRTHKSFLICFYLKAFFHFKQIFWKEPEKNYLH